LIRKMGKMGEFWKKEEFLPHLPDEGWKDGVKN
jgi:hypothetical protein